MNSLTLPIQTGESRVEYRTMDSPTIPVSCRMSRFKTDRGVTEYHLVIHPTAAANFEVQLNWVEAAYRHVLATAGLSENHAVMRRFFCSDLVNQAPVLKTRPFTNPSQPDEPCAIAWAGQPPVAEAKIALWTYLVEDAHGPMDKKMKDGALVLKRDELTHYWTSGLRSVDDETSYGQTRAILRGYDGFLRDHGMALADHIVRTWFVVRDIDTHYSGLVAARKEFFAQHGLTPQTHFIASTGIGGTHADLRTLVGLDAYAIAGLRPAQVEYLSAPDHLSPTHVYGVTFERGVTIGYHDRRQVILSGTASIDSAGKILHPGNVSRQLDRTLENMGALLKTAGASLEDMAVFVVYLRDGNDQAMIWPQLRERLGDAPIQMVVAPVCRPGWLIELEGMAILPASNPGLPSY